MQQSERQPVQPDPSQVVHEPASNVAPVPFFHDVPEDPEEARDDDDDGDSWWWNESIKEKPGLAIPFKRNLTKCGTMYWWLQQSGWQRQKSPPPG